MEWWWWWTTTYNNNNGQLFRVYFTINKNQFNFIATASVVGAVVEKHVSAALRDQQHGGNNSSSEREIHNRIAQHIVIIWFFALCGVFFVIEWVIVIVSFFLHNSSYIYFIAHEFILNFVIAVIQIFVRAILLNWNKKKKNNFIAKRFLRPREFNVRVCVCFLQ